MGLMGLIRKDSAPAVDNDCEVHPVQQAIMDVRGDDLKIMSEEILRVAHSTEHHFLDIGERLQSFYADAGLVADLAAEVIAKLSGDDTDRAIASLSDVVDKIGGYIGHEKNETQTSLQSLNSILVLLFNVNDSLEGFRKIIKVLHALGTSTKIESVRIGDDNAGFYTLAMDVEKLAEQIKSKSASIIAKKDELAREILHTVGTISEISARELHDADEIFKQIGNAVSSLTERKERNASAVCSLTDLTGELSASVAGIVSSLQFHDITRQQMEHVREAIDDVIVKMADGSASDTEIASIITLQAAQLEHGVQEFSSAVDAIADGLTNVGFTASGITSGAMEMAGVATDGGKSFLSGIDATLASVTGILSDSGETNRKLSSAMISVSETIGDITCFVNDIEDIGTEIELIALNAQVKAARTGSEGAALGVLAEAIQKLSVEARSQSVAVSTILREVTSASDSLSSSISSEAETLQSEVNSVLGELEMLVAALGDINRETLPSLRKINDVTKELSCRIEETVRKLTVNHEVADVLTPIVGKLRALFPMAAGAAGAVLKELASRYTMNSERNVHAKFTGFPASGRSVAPAVQAAAPDDLGDNVELF